MLPVKISSSEYNAHYIDWCELISDKENCESTALVI